MTYLHNCRLGFIGQVHIFDFSDVALNMQWQKQKHKDKQKHNNHKYMVFMYRQGGIKLIAISFSSENSGINSTVQCRGSSIFFGWFIKLMYTSSLNLYYTYRVFNLNTYFVSLHDIYFHKTYITWYKTHRKTAHSFAKKSKHAANQASFLNSLLLSSTLPVFQFFLLPACP